MKLSESLTKHLLYLGVESVKVVVMKLKKVLLVVV